MEEAEKLNIELIKVPEGTTDICQPLDRNFFGHARALLTDNNVNDVLENFDIETFQYKKLKGVNHKKRSSRKGDNHKKNHLEKVIIIKKILILRRILKYSWGK